MNNKTETVRQIFFYEDYWVQDLILQNDIMDKTFFYCEPCLLAMRKEDTKKSRQQLRILYEYLNYDRNFTNIAKRLDMHRNNVIYHIKHIEEQYDLDLDDAETRLKLLHHLVAQQFFIIYPIFCFQSGVLTRCLRRYRSDRRSLCHTPEP